MLEWSFLFLRFMKKQPIGIFDSGIGGTSILKEIVKLLPNEDFIYLADSANAPYGQKSAKEIIALCKKNVEFLLEKECKLIVVACNTATTNAIAVLREVYAIPFIGIEPAIKPAVLNTKTNTIGILATKGTLNSKLFSEKIDLYSADIKIIEVIGKGLVECLEQGDFDSEYLIALVEGYVKPMLKQQIDYLVLGCSHYPYLLPILKKIVPQGIQIIDSGQAVAKQTKHILSTHNLITLDNFPGNLILYTNTDKRILCRICKNIFNKKALKVLKLHF